MPTFPHGKLTVVKIDNAAGALQNLSTYINSSSLQRMVETLETTCFSATDKTFIVGFKEAKIPVGGNWDPTLDAHMEGILAKETVSVELYPEGEGTGKKYYTCEAILISYEASMGISQVTTWSGELQVTGAVTLNTDS
jgi:hypothetical protein